VANFNSNSKFINPNSIKKTISISESGRRYLELMEDHLVKPLPIHGQPQINTSTNPRGQCLACHPINE